MFSVRHTYDLLDRSGSYLGPLHGVVEGSGSVSRSSAASVKASAQVTVVDTGQVKDWTQVRVRPVIEVNGETWPLGVFLPDVPERQHGEQQQLEITLLDKTTILAGDAFGTTFGVQKGTNISLAVREVIETTGEPATGIEDMGELLLTSLESEPDDSKLSVVNQLLDACNCFSLYTDGQGNFRTDPYLAPARRPVEHEFVDGEGARVVGLYLPEFTSAQDVGSVPNRVRVVSQSEEDEPALTAEAVNENPDSPFSFGRLGYWRTHIESDVKTISQKALQEYAARRLADLSSPQETIELQHPPYQFSVNSVVSFESRRDELAGLYTVVNQDWDLSFDGMVTSKLRKVVEL